MEYFYVGKRDDYRNAFYADLGETYEFNLEPDTKEIFLAVSVCWIGKTTKLRLIDKVIGRLKRYVYHSIKYLNFKIEVGGQENIQRIILSGHSKDWMLYSDLNNDWYDIFIPIEKNTTETFKIYIEALDHKGNSIKVLGLNNFVLFAKPVFLKRKHKKNIIYITLESLTDFNYLKEKGLISDRTYQLYEQVFADFNKVKGSISQVDWTFPAAVSYHTGLLTSQHRMYNSEKIKRKEDCVDKRLITIAEMLKKEGYITFSANLGKLHAENGFAKGIDCYYKPASSLGFIEYTGDDKWVIKKLELFRHSCFIHLHYDRLHHPLFSTTGPWSRIRSKENPQLSADCRLLNPETYYETNLVMLLLDLNNVINYLKINNRFDETIFIVTSDHGYDFGEWIDMKQETPLLESRLRVPYLINQKSLISSKNASIRPFIELCSMLNITLPEYYSKLPQMDTELSKYTFSESVLKTKKHIYVLGIGDDQHRYYLYADIDWNNFKIRSIEREYVVNCDSEQVQNEQTVREKFIALRKKYFDLNSLFYKSVFKNSNTFNQGV